MSSLRVCVLKRRLFLSDQWFERVVELDEHNVEALVGLAIITMNGGKVEDVKKAMEIFRMAYQIDPTHSRILNHLSNHFFYKKEFDKMENLARRAWNNTTNAKIKAESYFFLGRCMQAQQKYDEAYRLFYDAARHWPEHTLAHFGLGQMYIHKGNLEKACECLEKVRVFGLLSMRR